MRVVVVVLEDGDDRTADAIAETTGVLGLSWSDGAQAPTEDDRDETTHGLLWDVFVEAVQDDRDRQDEEQAEETHGR